eukprot:Nk52_evm25s228 gene=Nk52_evmTU25s228
MSNSGKEWMKGEGGVGKGDYDEEKRVQEGSSAGLRIGRQVGFDDTLIDVRDFDVLEDEEGNDPALPALTLTSENISRFGVSSSEGTGEAIEMKNIDSTPISNSSVGHSSTSALLSRPKVIRPFFTLEVLTRRETIGFILISIALIAIFLVYGGLVYFYAFHDVTFDVPYCNGTEELDVDDTGCISRDPNIPGAVYWNRTFSWQVEKGSWSLSVKFGNVAKKNIYEGISYRLDIWANDLEGNPNYRIIYLNPKLECSTNDGLCQENVIAQYYDVLCSSGVNCDTIAASVSTFKTRLWITNANVVQDSMPIHVEFAHFDVDAFPFFAGFYVAISLILWGGVGFLLFNSFKAAPWKDWVIQHKIAVFGGITACCQANVLSVVALYEPSLFWVYAFRWILVASGYVGSLFAGLLLLHSFRFRSAVKSLPFAVYKWKIVNAAAIFSIVAFFFIWALVNGRKYLYFCLVGNNSLFVAGNVFNEDDGDRAIHYIAIALPLIFLCWIFVVVVWLIVLTVKAFKLLKRLPYLTCRFRHIALRTQLIFIIIGILFNVVFTILAAIAKSTYTTNAQRITTFEYFFNSSQMLNALFSLITLYFFTPAGISGHSVDSFLDNSKGFSIADARLLVIFASEAYRIGSTKKGLTPEAYNYTLLNVATDKTIDANAIVCKKGKRLVVAYRGTKTKKNLKTDLKTKQITIEKDWVTSETRRPSTSGNGMGSRLFEFWAESVSDVLDKGVRVHEGFWEAHMRVKDTIISEVCKNWDPNDGPVYLTGHSLGGALASLLAFELSIKHKVPCVIYTLGCRRIGNKRFARLFRKFVPSSYRVCMDGDVITGLPRWNYTPHEENEIVIDSKGNLFVNLSGYEKAIMTKTRRKFSSHKMISYRHAINAAVKVDGRLGIYLDSEEKSIEVDADVFMFKKDRVSLRYGLASMLPVASLTGAVLNGDDIPKPPMDIPEVMFLIDDLTEQSTDLGFFFWNNETSDEDRAP